MVTTELKAYIDRKIQGYDDLILMYKHKKNTLLELMDDVHLNPEKKEKEE